MIKYSTYCTSKGLSKKEQRKLFKEIELCNINIKKGKTPKKSSDKITELKNKIVSSYIPMVIQAIQKYRTNTAIDLDDLLHEGILGLYYAINKFKYKRNNKFSTYALPWVDLKIKLASKSHYALDISPHFLRKFKKYQEEENKLKEEADKSTKKYPLSYLSLQNICSNNDNNHIQTVSDTIPDPNAKIPNEVCEQKDTDNYIKMAIKSLKVDEQYIINNRYGFDGDKLTLEQIGKKLSLSRERIFAKEREILNKLSYRIKLNA